MGNGKATSLEFRPLCLGGGGGVLIHENPMLGSSGSRILVLGARKTRQNPMAPDFFECCRSLVVANGKLFMSSASWILQRIDGPEPVWKGIIDIAKVPGPLGYCYVVPFLVSEGHA